MVGLGHKFPVAQARPAAAEAAQDDQRSMIGASLFGETGGEVVRAGVGQFEVEHNQVGVVALGQLQPGVGLAGRQDPQSAAFQGGLEDLAGIVGVIDNQYASFAVQGPTLPGGYRSDLACSAPGARPAWAGSTDWEPRPDWCLVQERIARDAVHVKASCSRKAEKGNAKTPERPVPCFAEIRPVPFSVFAVA